MITTSDIKKILFQECKRFGVPTFFKESIPKGKLPDERITIVTHNIQDGGVYWDRCMVEVNWLMPDVAESANVGLDDVERMLEPLHYGVGVCNGTQYRYEKSSVGLEKEEGFDGHYINLKLLFNIQKVKNNGRTDFCH